MKAETTTQQKINIIGHFIRMYRCVEEFDGLSYDFFDRLERLGSGPSVIPRWEGSRPLEEEYTEVYERSLSTAESLALATLAGDPRASFALADHLQEIGIDPGDRAERVLSEMEADERWTLHGGVEVVRPFREVMIEFRKRLRYDSDRPAEDRDQARVPSSDSETSPLRWEVR